MTCSIPPSRYLPGTIVVPVYSSQDVEQRLRYNTTQHVTLEVRNSLFDVNWFFNSSFSNTTLLSYCGSGFTLQSALPTNMTLIVNKASNFFMYNLNISLQFEWNTTLTYTGWWAGPCIDERIKSLSNWFARNRYWFAGRPCPAVLLAETNNTELVNNSVYGGLQLLNVAESRVEGNFVTTLDNGYGIAVSNYFDDPANTYSPCTVTNNRVNASEGILIGIQGVNGARYVLVANNNVSNFRWSGIITGSGAISNEIRSNYVFRNAGYPVTADSPGMYFAGFRYTPNNTVLFNYLNLTQGGGHCFYNDYWTAGTVIDTNICQTSGGFTYKQNMGWGVTIKNFLAYGGATISGWCEDIQSTTCPYAGVPPSLPADVWNTLEPYAAAMCGGATHVSQTSIDGIPCSANATLLAAAGNCSGLALLNDIQLAVVKPSSVDGWKAPQPLSFLNSSTGGHLCHPYPIGDVLNTFNATVYLPSNISFASGLLGVVPNSTLADNLPAIAAFPFNVLGIQPFDQSNLRGISPPLDLQGSTLGQPDAVIITVAVVAPIIGIGLIFGGAYMYRVKFYNPRRRAYLNAAGLQSPTSAAQLTNTDAH
ncbi:hypothetical protein BDK51DRAFT_45183 [Blyttiomyces helicus]|uniref:Uncharacterized protein n=1 Tax=Blyttiomyces helicus TaxID=388810 RepID=A0A4P9WMB2_9FUNG|nr:hypothetical protein BDK51DRAFT_45183 [Blyttiomyces helicus]|eukprot:RKO94211.1 hypothetical protein BDK51DRAFT_45183 [Blyttiomyces helicus]